MVPIWVSFKDPSYCDDPLGGSGTWNLKGLKDVFEASQLWWLEMGNHFLTPKKDQFRVQGWGKMGWNDTNLARLRYHIFISTGWFSLSATTWQFAQIYLIAPFEQPTHCLDHELHQDEEPLELEAHVSKIEGDEKLMKSWCDLGWIGLV